MKYNVLFIIFSAFALLHGCSDTGSDDTENTLILGTGLGHGIVTGATESFTGDSEDGSVIIYWSLETKHDMSGYRLRVLIEEKAGNKWNERRIFDYGIIADTLIYYYIDSFYHEFGTGTFRATAFISDNDVASTEYMVE